MLKSWTFDLHQTYFSLALGDSSLLDYYAEFSYDVRRSTVATLFQLLFKLSSASMSLCMWLGFCLSCLRHMNYDPIRSKLLGIRIYLLFVRVSVKCLYGSTSL